MKEGVVNEKNAVITDEIMEQDVGVGEKRCRDNEEDVFVGQGAVRENIKKKSWRQGLNLRPAHYECAALPAELHQLIYSKISILKALFNVIHCNTIQIISLLSLSPGRHFHL